jgi:hypothetical protein
MVQMVGASCKAVQDSFQQHHNARQTNDVLLCWVAPGVVVSAVGERPLAAALKDV